MTVSSGQVEDPHLSTLRDIDRDRYLAALLMPEEKRGAIAALYAFNAELARVRDIVHEPMPGEIRLQWWRDLVGGAGSSEGLSHPVAAALAKAIGEYKLPVAPLVAMTEARIFDLYDDPMPGISEFEGYAGETASALIQLTGMVLEPEGAMAAADAAGHAGIAQLVAGCLLLLPTHIARHQVYLPADILLSVGLNSEALLRSEDKVRIAAAIRAFAGYGRDHLAKARAAAAGKLAGPLACAFLPVSLAETIFDRAEKAGYGVLEKSMRPSQLARQWRLWRSFRSHRF